MDINTLDPSVLTERQKTVAHDIVRSGRETCDILKEHGVCEDEFTEWVTDGIFPLYVSHLAVAFAGAEEPFVWAKLLTLIRNDNLQAIKLYFTYRAALRLRGLEVLADRCDGMRVSVECDPDALPVYGRDYFLGDLCDVTPDKIGLSFSLRLTEADTVWENGQMTVFPIFGDEIRSIKKLLGDR